MLLPVSYSAFTWAAAHESVYTNLCPIKEVNETSIYRRCILLKVKVNSNCLLLLQTRKQYCLKSIYFDILLSQILIRLYFYSETVFHKD